MAWETRGGKRYYYRARRVGKRVVKEYVGSGDDAAAAAVLDAKKQVKRGAANAALKKLRADVAAAKVLEKDERRDFSLQMYAYMTERGYHYHRGEWRRKRDEI